ncbi:protein mono-ADP-ribosyltransferase PARP14 isoform X1 [Coregonus clupeaformis]|uniref:protein mono-ADP-ribosyltransferase PARP14 isoform X1 n=1 Tax=Coregonus clupeaformis TaxID=59861 RepID=UPI001E1C8265|nr:protein mono-ADP-ribosyltransferase PARP14 isoform X1 [Coregonus clupeaformis]
MEVYKYPVFFEAHSLDSAQKEKIEKYFQVRRKSGGGDCGPINKVGDNVYKIAFIDGAVQKRVLQKPNHVLEMPGGPLSLTLRGSLEPPPTTTSPVSSQSSHQSLPFHPCLPVETSPPGDLEHELHLDSYLLRYLKESPGAGRDLQQQLSSLSCSVHLHPEDGRAVVRGSGQAGSCGDGVGVGPWKAQVERLFKQLQEQYKCHYEVDPRKLQTLLQSSTLGSEDVRVYCEAGEGFAVVVGEEAEVQAKMKALEAIQGQGLSSGKQEKISTTCRLGQAKLRLLGEVIEKDLGEAVPGVRVTRGDSAQLVLEGSASEVRTARQLVRDKISLVLQRVVPEVSPHLLSFLRDEYGRPGNMRSLLGLGRQVEIELGDTELHLFSLSSGKLDQAEKSLLGEFGEEKVDVPNCAALPSELKSKLEKKVKEMNQSRRRVVTRYGPGCRVQLLGHMKQVQELRKEIGTFLIDQSSVEETVCLPYPEIADHLPKLLERIGVDHAGVTLYPSASAIHPTVVLCGPSVRVAQVRDRLGPALASLVHQTVTIDQPGALRYFQGLGREYLEVVGRSQHCVIQLHNQGGIAGEAGAGPRLEEMVTATSYCLQRGLQVVVRQGDITKERADALVNAANEDLDHAGGVAAALSRAGGPEVQRASRDLVRQIGRVPTGTVVETTGGNLPCKMLLHAVGPVGGSVGGNERPLLEKTVKAALDLAETLELQTLAMPCISSGIFGIPLKVCSEAIVSAVRDFGREQHILTKVTLIDVSGEAVKAMQEACDRLFQGKREFSGWEGESSTTTTTTTHAPQRDTTSASAREAATPEVCVQVEIIQGTIEKQKVDALVSPMVGSDPLSSRVGNVLSEAAGPGLMKAFLRESGGQTAPGDYVLVDGLSGLSSGRVFFLSCAHWDNNSQGPAVQALRQGVRRVLASCENQGFCSVAFPVVGTGAVLMFPHNVATQVLLEEIRGYEQNRASRSPFLVRIIIHPTDRYSTKAFQTSQSALHVRWFVMDASPDQTSFYRHISTTQDEVSAMLGSVKLQLVFGDIIRETTDVIVNTTDFSANHSGVSKAILTAAGSTVQAELAQVGVPADWMCTTGPGALGCKEIVHVCFKCDTQRINKVCGKILKQCERKGLRSAAFPAINTGAARADAGSMCKAMLDGFASRVRDLSPNILSVIRIVMLQRPVFQAFKSELESRLGTIAPTPTLKERAQRILKKKLNIGFSSPAHGCLPPSSAQAGLTITPWRPPPAVLSVVGSGVDAIRGARRELDAILQNQLTQREVKGEDLCVLEEVELQAVQKKAKALGVSLELGRIQRAGGVEAWAGAGGGGGAAAGEGFYVLQGLTEDVLSVREVLDSALSGALRRELNERNEAVVALSVQWSMCRHSDIWEELGMHANYLLEQAHLRGEVSAELEVPDGSKVKVNLKNNVATDWRTGHTLKLKREESAKLPSYWDDMAAGETLKRVLLLPTSPEYQEVAQGFQSTTAAHVTIHKIERVQNVFLWQAYALCEQRIRAKNGPAEVGLKKLYHGTAATTCDAIESNGFDRSYANITAYGVGVYFAVKASYSSNPRYTPPDGSGHRHMYVARVLTGRYTLGDPSMKFTPRRSPTDPTDRYDSLVDNQQTPSMFVIFHDDQAYPEYLITFV